MYSFAIDVPLRDALRQLKARDGISESEQIRRALRLWFRKHDITVGAADRSRGRTAEKGGKKK